MKLVISSQNKASIESLIYIEPTLLVSDEV